MTDFATDKTALVALLLIIAFALLVILLSIFVVKKRRKAEEEANDRVLRGEWTINDVRRLSGLPKASNPLDTDYSNAEVKYHHPKVTGPRSV